MLVSHSPFLCCSNLAEDVFKLQHLLDCHILKYRDDIEELTNAAGKEEQIEKKLAVLQVILTAYMASMPLA